VNAKEEGGKESETTKTDADGNYLFEVAGGMYTITSAGTGYEDARYGPFEIHAKEIKQIDLTLVSAKFPRSSMAAPAFFDEPQFTVAGVTDTSNLGGHASSTMGPRAESLTKDIASLKNSGDEAPASQADLERARGDARAAVTKNDRADLHHLLGNLAEKSGDPLEAVREYQRAAEMDPSEANLFDWGAELLLHRAVEPAIEVFSKGNRTFPKSSRMLTGLGVAWYARGNYDEAARRLCEASDLNPHDSQPYVFLGKIQNVDPAQSAAIFKRVERYARLQPDSAWANYWYAIALLRNGTHDSATSAQAESLLQNAVRLQPNLADGYVQLGILSSERKDFGRAVAVLQQAIKINPRLLEAHYRLAQAYGAMGEKQQAHQEIEVYKQFSKETAAEDERERREVRQFVYTMKGQSDAKPQ
jgi:tetratricopeptide (TPR) repeat protein